MEKLLIRINEILNTNYSKIDDLSYHTLSGTIEAIADGETPIKVQEKDVRDIIENEVLEIRIEFN